MYKALNANAPEYKKIIEVSRLIKMGDNPTKPFSGVE
jgi:hypothetical protein